MTTNYTTDNSKPTTGAGSPQITVTYEKGFRVSTTFVKSDNVTPEQMAAWKRLCQRLAGAIKEREVAK